MGSLRDKLLRQIRETGPMTLSEYMESCLLDPEYGYYCGTSPVGAKGSFTTAPEISQMFGELIGICIGQAWMQQGRPEKFTLAELGPGRGTLMRDLLRATRKIPGFNGGACIHLVERGPHLRRQQARALHRHDPAWCRDPDELPQMPLFLVANEFFDALPIRQFTRGRNSWTETLVDYDDDGLIFGASGPVELAELAAREADVFPSETVELRNEAARITGILSRIIRRFGGTAVAIDYGEFHLKGDTFQAVRDHVHADPLANPGQADLTSHVDFGAIAAAAEGVDVSPLVTQREFLGRLGIEVRARRLARAAGTDQLKDHIAAYNRLTSPEEMGTLFKVMALYPQGAPMPPGFD